MSDDLRGGKPDRRHPHRLPPEFYRRLSPPISMTVRSRWTGSLAQPGIADALISAMGRMGARYGVRIHAYCIMPDHVHAVVSVGEDGGDLEKWLRYFKREGARAARIQGSWQRSYWDRYVREREDPNELVQYVIANPVRRDLCDRWSDWPYSWAESEDHSRGPNPMADP